MTNLDVGSRVIASGKKPRLLDLLIAIVKDDPDETAAFHHREAKRLLLNEGYEEYLDDALTRIIALEYGNAIRAVATPSKKDIQARVASAAKAKAKEDDKMAQAKTIIGARIAKFIVLDLTMPNGKKLRDCTGHECTKLGGLFATIGKRVGATKTVGDVLSEEDLAGMQG